MKSVKLILASSSPRRAQLLRDSAIAFEVREPHVQETLRPGETAEQMVARLAEEKARSIAAQFAGDEQCIDQQTIDQQLIAIIGSDTAVEIDGTILGKPRDAAHAREMLEKLSGRTHRVLTGIFVLRLPDGRLPNGASRAAVESTSVTFAPLNADEIDAYVATQEPFDKAGAYAIQGRAGRYITRIEGCYFNVVGLPLARLYAMLREIGWTDKP